MKFKSRFLLDQTTKEYIWFAWYPVRCEDGFIRWLEKVKVKKSYWIGPVTGSLYCDKFYYEYMRK